MEQSKMITYILVFLLGFIISKIIPDLCDKLYENSIIERFIIGGQSFDQEMECISGQNEGNCGACYIITQDADDNYIYTLDIDNLIESSCTSDANIERNWMRQDIDEAGTITYSHGLICNPNTYLCDEPCLR